MIEKLVSGAPKLGAFFNFIDLRGAGGAPGFKPVARKNRYVLK